MQTEISHSPSRKLQHSELRVADAVGALMELWGFRRQLGRVWSVLFLSDKPLAAPELCERLQISTGLLSMSLSELRRWGVVRTIPVPGSRKEHFEAETHIWKLVRQVLAQRERKAMEDALRVFEEALSAARGALVDASPRAKTIIRHQVHRLEQLVTLTRAGLGLLRVLLESARVDLSPLKMLSEMFSARGAVR